MMQTVSLSWCVSDLEGREKIRAEYEELLGGSPSALETNRSKLAAVSLAFSTSHLKPSWSPTRIRVVHPKKVRHIAIVDILQLDRFSPQRWTASVAPPSSWR